MYITVRGKRIYGPAPVLQLQENELFQIRQFPDLLQCLPAWLFIHADGHHCQFPGGNPTHAHVVYVHILPAQNTPHLPNDPGFIDLLAEYEAPLKANVDPEGAHFGQVGLAILHPTFHPDLPQVRDCAGKLGLHIRDLDLMEQLLHHYAM